MAACDVQRCPVHGVKLKRGQCPGCLREAQLARRRLVAMAQPRDEHGSFIRQAPIPGVDESVDRGDNATGDDVA